MTVKITNVTNKRPANPASRRVVPKRVFIPAGQGTRVLAPGQMRRMTDDTFAKHEAFFVGLEGDGLIKIVRPRTTPGLRTLQAVTKVVQEVLAPESVPAVTVTPTSDEPLVDLGVVVDVAGAPPEVRLDKYVEDADAEQADVVEEVKPKKVRGKKAKDPKPEKAEDKAPKKAKAPKKGRGKKKSD